MSIGDISITTVSRISYYFITLVILIFLGISCSDNPSSNKPEPEPEPEPMGSVQVKTITKGLDPNPRGYTVDISNVEIFQIDANATIKSEEIEEGNYSVELTDIEDHCTIQSENPVIVEVNAGETSSVEFEIECKGIFRNNIVFFRPQSQSAKFAKSMVTHSYYTLKPDDSNIQNAGNLTKDGYVHFLSDISPDGTKMVIAFAENKNGVRSNYRIAIVNAYDNSIHYLIEESDDTNYYHPVFSPDGDQIAFTGYSDNGLFGDIYVMDADGANVTKVTNTEDLDEQPDWSPDGTQLIFQRSSSDYKHMGIFTININGSDERLISDSDLEFSSPHWSPDGNQILVVGSQRDENGYSYSEIYTMNSDGSSIKKVAGKKGQGIFHSAPRWSPDGNTIIFSSNRSGEPDEEFGYSYEPYDLFKVNKDGSDLMNLTNSSEISETNAMWSPVED